MRRRNKNKKQVRLLIATTICILLLMTIGYAAFTTNLTINAKGNIKNSSTFLSLTKKLVTTGDGLYKDEYEENKYTYRGISPNNYITFNNELWRIISINNNGIAKIIKEKSIGRFPFDSATTTADGPRYNENNTYCFRFHFNGYYGGCNAWAKVPGDFSHDGITGTVTQDSEINTYLNNTYYNSFSEEAKAKIVKGDFYFGAPNDGDTVIQEIEKEKLYIWNGNVGLLSPSEYLRLPFNSQCRTIQESFTYNKCTDNYIYEDSKKYKYDNIALISGRNSYHTYVISDGPLYQGAITGGPAKELFEIKPVVFVTSDTLLTGSGTEQDPYIIK